MSLVASVLLHCVKAYMGREKSMNWSRRSSPDRDSDSKELQCSRKEVAFAISLHSSWLGLDLVLVVDMTQGTAQSPGTSVSSASSFQS